MRSGGRVFFDTNVLVYAFTRDDPRWVSARALLSQGGVVGVQALNEFVAVARRKLRMPWKEVLEALSVIRTFCPSPVPVTLTIHERAVEIAQRYGYRIYDALLIAAAVEASCHTLYSEDLHDGQVIDGLAIRNPFRGLCLVP
jgi:predicted nucleic acid-binding protein